MQEADIWDKAGIDLESFDYCAFPPDAEKALFAGDIDFISGDHFAHTKRAETKQILEKLSRERSHSFNYETLEKMPRKPYPDAQAIINAYELGCIKSPEAKQLSPLALWDLHYLRQLDNSGFIDKLYA